MTYSLDYSRATSTENSTELAIWNLAAHQASTGAETLQSALLGIEPRHSCHVVNAYRVVAEAVAAGLLVDEAAIETLCHKAGSKGKSLEITLKSVGYWMHDTATAYWEQGRGDARIDAESNRINFDRIRDYVSITVEDLGFSEVAIRCDQFDLTYTVSVWDKTKKRRVSIARAVMLDDILTMVNKWAIALTIDTEMSRSFRVLNGFEDQVVAA